MADLTNHLDLAHKCLEMVLLSVNHDNILKHQMLTDLFQWVELLRSNNNKMQD